MASKKTSKKTGTGRTGRPRTRPADTEQQNIYLPASMRDAMRKLAGRNRRVLTAEYRLAIEEHLRRHDASFAPPLPERPA
jgi:hypothetical protein